MYDINADACMRTTTPPARGAGTGRRTCSNLPPRPESCHARIVGVEEGVKSDCMEHLAVDGDAAILRR
jgi:hypothetical protein